MEKRGESPTFAWQIVRKGMEKQYKFIDLFCGIGGFRLALERQNCSCVFSSDIDVFARQTYCDNFNEWPSGDITKIDERFIPEFDILAAGFPCQPFSYSGLCQGFEDETRGTLFFDVCRILAYHKPKMFFLENVKGIVSHKRGETLRVIERKLRDLGYDIHWKVLSSLDYGLPQKRERWYCVGFDTPVPFEFPEPLKGKPTLRDIVDPNEHNPSLRLSKLELERIHYHFAHCDKETRVHHDNSKYLPQTKKGRYGVYSYQKPDGSLRFHVGDVAKTQIQEAFYACLDTYAPTIIAGRTPKLWDIERRLSVLEAKRLQGFPDNFKFTVSDNQAYKQLGNSVSIPVVTLIAEKMIKSYEKTLLCSTSQPKPLGDLSMPLEKMSKTSLSVY
ncbi:MAG: DNA cytosine methyltransferase [Prevotellaceae bacterium]|nr:DNA cytosine methyltransferase [Prevotellaceae bacterium]